MKDKFPGHYQVVSNSVAHMLNLVPPQVGNAILSSLLCLHCKDTGITREEFIEVMGKSYDITIALGEEPPC